MWRRERERAVIGRSWRRRSCFFFFFLAGTRGEGRVEPKEEVLRCGVHTRRTTAERHSVDARSPSLLGPRQRQPTRPPNGTRRNIWSNSDIHFQRKKTKTSFCPSSTFQFSFPSWCYQRSDATRLQGIDIVHKEQALSCCRCSFF